MAEGVTLRGRRFLLHTIPYGYVVLRASGRLKYAVPLKDGIDLNDAVERIHRLGNPHVAELPARVRVHGSDNVIPASSVLVLDVDEAILQAVAVRVDEPA